MLKCRDLRPEKSVEQWKEGRRRRLKGFLYLNFRLTLSVSNGLGRWDCPAACRRQDSGADELSRSLRRFSRPGKQLSPEGRQLTPEGKQLTPEGKQLTFFGKQLTFFGSQLTFFGNQLTSCIKKAKMRGKRVVLSKNRSNMGFYHDGQLFHCPRQVVPSPATGRVGGFPSCKDGTANHENPF